jgi:hypothetical protein
MTMTCKGCKPQNAGGANPANCVAGTYKQVKCYAIGDKCAGQAVYERTIDANCNILASSYKDDKGDPITVAQWDAIVIIDCPDRGFNCSDVQKDLCVLLQESVLGATSVTPVGTDKVRVVRADGSCAVVDLSALLTDIQIQSVANAQYNPATGVLTFSITESNGDVYPFNVTIGPWVETPLVVQLEDAAGNDLTATNVTQSGPVDHTVKITLPPQPVEPQLQITLKDSAGNDLTATNVSQSGVAGHTAEITLPPQPVIPAEVPLVVTKNGSTAGVVQSGTLDHTVDILVETTEVYVNGAPVPDSDTSATNRRYDITIPVCTDVSAQTPTELLPGSVFAATDADDCERKLFKIPDCPVCPAPAIEQSGSLVQLDQAALDLIKVNVAGGGPLPTLGSAVLENIGSMVVPGAIAAENFDITFTAASTDPHIIFVSNVMGSASFETFSFIGVTTGNGNATLLDSTTLVNGALRNRSMVIVVQPTASGAINVRYNANRMTNWMNTVHPIINANIANPVLGYTKRSWNPGPGNTFPSTFPSGQTDTTGIVEPTRNGYASSSSIVTAVVARHLKGWDAAGNNMRQPPNADNQPGIEQQSSTSPPQTTVGFAALNQISQQNNTFVCPQSIHVLNNPTDGSMIINRDGSGFGTTYYIELGQNAVTGGGEDTVSTQNISLSPKVCGGCCEASNGIVHFEPATVVATLEPTADIELTFIVNGASSTISLVNDGATVKTHKVPVPPVQQLVAVPCPSGIDASASLLVKVNTLSAAGNSVTIDTLTLKGAAL